MAYRQIQILLQNRGESLLADGERVTSRRQIQKSEMSIRIGRLCPDKVGIEILRFDGRTGNASAFFIQNVTLHRRRRDLRLAPSGRRKHQRDSRDKEGAQ